MEWLTLVQILITAVVTIIGQNFFTEWIKRREARELTKLKQDGISSEAIRGELWKKVTGLETEVKEWRSKHEEMSIKYTDMSGKYESLKVDYGLLEQRCANFQSFVQEYLELTKAVAGEKKVETDAQNTEA